MLTGKEEEFEEIIKWMENMYSKGTIPTVESLMRGFGLTQEEALAVIAEFHKRYPIAFPMTFEAAKRVPDFWMAKFSFLAPQKRRLGPPGVPRPHPTYRRLSLLLFLVGIGLTILAASLYFLGFGAGV